MGIGQIEDVFVFSIEYKFLFHVLFYIYDT